MSMLMFKGTSIMSIDVDPPSAIGVLSSRAYSEAPWPSALARRHTKTPPHAQGQTQAHETHMCQAVDGDAG